MKVVHFGAGNIGRGLIGQILNKNKFTICFVDTNIELIQQLNQDGGYIIEIIDKDSKKNFVDRVVALNSVNEIEKVIKAIEEADILTTSVGANNLAKIAPIIARGLNKRFLRKASINVLANENLINASDILKREIYSLLTEKERIFFDKFAYFVNTTIDRQSFSKKVDGKVISSVEPYYEWVINRQQMDPTTSYGLKNVLLTDDIRPYIERKLYIVNAAHAAIAYVGNLKGYKTIQEAIQDQWIFNLVNQFLLEVLEYFVYEYELDREQLKNFIKKTLKRQSNEMLLDKIDRVGRSPIRKLGSNDRLIGPVLKLYDLNLPYEAGIKIIAAGYHYYDSNDPESEKLYNMINKKGLKETIANISELNGELLYEVMTAYNSLP